VIRLTWAGSRDHVLRTVVPLASELPRLFLLFALTAAAFAGTRWFAARERSTQLSDAAQWRTRGERAVAAGQVEDAIADFRHAMAKDRVNLASSLALAGALVTTGQLDEAEQVLTQVRERTPDNIPTNVLLARVAARRTDTTSAMAYFRNALYAPGVTQGQRFELRLEIGAFLLAQHRPAQALPELIAASSEGGGDAAARTKLASMLLQAGDARRALQAFQGLASEGTNPEALAGAGIAAFQLGKYATALSYLNRAPRTAATDEPRSISDLVVARDPLAARIGRTERVRRATDNIATVRGRLQACLPQATGSAHEALSAALADVGVNATRVPSGDRDALEDGVAAAGRAARALQQYCPSPDVADRALAIIAALHAGAP
jgi:tetratricopeptide (TPR) repeat protein